MALCKISDVPPWKVIYPKVDFTLSCYSKACTPESTYRTLYLEHRELFYDYEPIFTDGSKSESHVDSLSALQSIVSLHSSSHPILVDITYALANHLKKKDIRFCWIPGHAGITGNELADTAARSATGSSERFPIPHSDPKACFRQKLQSVWQSHWDQKTENKLHSVMPALAPTVPSSSNLREQPFGLTGCLFGLAVFGLAGLYCTSFFKCLMLLTPPDEVTLKEMSFLMVMFVRWLPLIIMGAMQNGRGHGHRHHNNNRLMELLTAGIVAKVLQKQEGDGGGGHEYYPVPIHLPIHHHHGHGMGMSASESHGHHHHVTEKIIPIP
ncbi:RNase H domain-containing protein [Trichonephila clavipes]|uniref:RNase H domain-containing protein n=1 Tax=Trichonephila clavipes TaxID=2585209 RepID=A0A8X6VNY9_TRICX|nr:RNase H domain-containing protein [Trichonephila clavipes]